MRGSVSVLLLLLGATVAIFGQNVRWSLDEALARALQKNLTLEQQRIDVRARREEADYAWNRFLPSLDASASVRRSDGLEDPWSLSTEVGARLTLYTSIRDRIEQTRDSYRSGEISLKQARQRLIRDVKRYFYQVLLYEDRIQLAEQNLELAIGQYEKTASLFEAGLASDLDLLAARVSRENARPQLLSLQNTYQSLLIELKLLTGLDPDDQMELIGEIAIPEIGPLDRDAILERAQRTSLEIKRLEQDLAASRRTRAIDFKETKVPNLSLSYSYSPSFSGPIADTIVEPDNWREEGSLGITLNVPLDSLIPHSRDDQALKTDDALIARSELALEQARYRLRIDVFDLLNTLTGTAETLRARELAAEQASESYRQTSLSYENGGRSLLEVEDARTGLLRAQVNVLNETYNYINTLIELEYTLGESISEE